MQADKFAAYGCKITGDQYVSEVVQADLILSDHLLYRDTLLANVGA